MKAIKNLSCLLSMAALVSCTKTVTEVKEPERIKPPETVMTTPGPSEISSGYIYLDPADGHYKSALFDFGNQLTHISSGYVTGQAGVGINSIAGNGSGLISAEIEGDKFTAYLPSFLTLPNYGPSYSTQKVTSWEAFEVDVSLTISVIGAATWEQTIRYGSIYLEESTNKYYALDSIKAKTKGVKLKNPLTSTTLTGPIFSPNSDGIVIYKGRILMNTNSPSGMAIYPINTEAINDIPYELGTYYIDNNINNYVIFRGITSEVNNGIGHIVEVLSYLPFSEMPTGGFRSEFDSSTGKYKIYVTCRGKLMDGRDFLLDDELLQEGVM